MREEGKEERSTHSFDRRRLAVVVRDELLLGRVEEEGSLRAGIVAAGESAETSFAVAREELRIGARTSTSEKGGESKGETYAVRDEVFVLPLARVRCGRRPANVGRRCVRVSRRSFRNDRVPILVEVARPLVVDGRFRESGGRRGEGDGVGGDTEEDLIGGEAARRPELDGGFDAGVATAVTEGRVRTGRGRPGATEYGRGGKGGDEEKGSARRGFGRGRGKGREERDD